MPLGELVNAYFCHLQRVYEVGIDLHLRAERSCEAPTPQRGLCACAAAEVGAAARPPLRRIGLDAALGQHETLQLGFRRKLATTHAAPRRNRYEEASTSSASSSGTSIGAWTASAPASAVTDSSAGISSVGWLASA